jgi:hypothetical protein
VSREISSGSGTGYDRPRARVGTPRVQSDDAQPQSSLRLVFPKRHTASQRLSSSVSYFWARAATGWETGRKNRLALTDRNKRKGLTDSLLPKDVATVEVRIPRLEGGIAVLR